MSVLFFELCKETAKILKGEIQIGNNKKSVEVM